MTFFIIWNDRTTAVSWVTAHMMCISIGYSVGPLILAQFLDENHRENTSEAYVNITRTDITRDYSGHFMYAFMIAGGLAFCVGLVFITTYCINISRFYSHGNIKANTEKRKEQYSISIRLIALCILYVLMNWSSVVYSGTGYAAYLTSYTVEELGMTKRQGAYLTSMFNAVKCFSRFCGIFLTRWFSFVHVLYFSIGLACVAYFSLAIFVNSFPQMIWIGTIFGALGCGNVFPMGLGWAERMLGNTRLPGILYGIGYKVSEVTAPIIIGNLFQYAYPDSYLYAVAGSAAACMISMIWMSILGRKGQQTTCMHEALIGEKTPLLDDQESQSCSAEATAQDNASTEAVMAK